MRILFTGSAGFIGQYAIKELLDHGHDVIGLDNLSKYGKTKSHLDFQQIDGDAKDVALLSELMKDCDQVVAGAAMIGGIGYFHQFSYDLLAENDRILASTFDAAIQSYQKGTLQKINVLSSSMVYENATQFPTPEGHEKQIPSPESSYGFQKLACEYYARAAFDQYQLPYTIIRPFNCVGIGEIKPQAMDEEISMVMGHVVTDLVLKVLKGQDPLHILGDGSQIRHFTYGGDLARGIRLCIESDKSICEDFNLSTPQSTTILELAEMIWRKIHPDLPFNFVSDPSFQHDISQRIPDVTKAKEILGFEANTSLSSVLDEVIPWVEQQMKEKRL